MFYIYQGIGEIENVSISSLQYMPVALIHIFTAKDFNLRFSLLFIICLVPFYLICIQTVLLQIYSTYSMLVTLELKKNNTIFL